MRGNRNVGSTHVGYLELNSPRREIMRSSMLQFWILNSYLDKVIQSASSARPCPPISSTRSEINGSSMYSLNIVLPLRGERTTSTRRWFDPASIEETGLWKIAEQHAMTKGYSLLLLFPFTRSEIAFRAV